MKWILCILVSLITAGCAANGAASDQSHGGAIVVRSPNGQVNFTLQNDRSPLMYSVNSAGMTVITPSPLVFTIDGTPLAEGAAVTHVDRSSANDHYDTRGVHSTASDKHNAAVISLRTVNGNSLTLEVRAFDDGIAFRFVNEAAADVQRTPDEATLFTLPAGSTVWSHNLRGHYEGTYERHKVEEIPAGDWVAPPFTFKLPTGGYASITEANLVNYSGMALQAAGHNAFSVGLAHRQPPSYPYTLRYSKEDVERLSHPATITGTITTPWRVVLVGKDLNTLVNSDIITSLNPPPDPKFFPRSFNTGWAKPGRAVWKYLDNGDRPAPTTSASVPATRPTTPPEEMKDFSRLAGKLGFEYNVLEGFWRRWTDEQLRDVVEDSARHGVGLFVWVHSKELRDPAVRTALFKRVHDAGVAGLKIDFFDHEHKEVIDLYQSILREAAALHLLLDFHGANKPTGGQRTWPNELTREAVRGMEARSLTDRAFHETTLPFTRFLAGPAEYTPVIFGSRRGDTTWAHQLALPVILTAPLMTYGANPRTLLDSPAVELIKNIPSTWDQTIVLPDSDISELAAFARRSGNTWFLGVANGPSPRKLTIPLSFLGDGAYTAITVGDVPGTAEALDVKHDQPFARGGTIVLDLPAGGGFVARFTHSSGVKK